MYLTMKLEWTDGVSLHAEGAQGIVACPFHFLLLYALLDEVCRSIYRMGIPSYGDDSVTGARREDALFRDLNVGAAYLLDFY